MPRPRVARASIVLVAIVTAAAVPAWGAVPADDEVPGAPVETAPERPPRHRLTAKVQELRQAMLDRLRELEELRQGALDAEAELAVNRDIARAKLDFEIGMLELQRGHQAALGNEDRVRELTPAIEVLRRMRSEIGGVVPVQPTPQDADNEDEAQ